MSLAAMHWARQTMRHAPASVKAPARLALMLLADYADEDHVSWPSLGTMAEEMGCSKRSVQRAIDALEDHGLVAVEIRHAANGRQQSNRYRLAVGGGCQSVTPSTSDQLGEGDNLTPSEGDKLAGEGDSPVRGRVTPVSPLESTTRTLPPSLSDAGEAPSVFDRAADLDDQGEPIEPEVGETSPQPLADHVGRKTSMTLEWEPEPAAWQRACWERGLAPDADVHQALIDFRDHFAARPGRVETPADWTRRFARWVAENLQRQPAQSATTGGAHANANRRERTPARRLTAAEARARDRARHEPGGAVYEGEHHALGH
ncbi:Helix-turn-helix domain-containing protein [Halomonas shengliensis]|uniref:Helix-turn-helix domain-containing protein n=1 Tax=Halomonas shengliensis TaxID=419597 RepID=A0A1H0LUE4_9GAMM|nr:helix-turn-helix domain-containing protein [Halomonas shengliensis]SDO71733.1 Helix-turn-helix domain-containing protein [Halomonas shengliensis]